MLLLTMPFVVVKVVQAEPLYFDSPLLVVPTHRFVVSDVRAVILFDAMAQLEVV
ncbi:hypothetical protein SDC9_85045 [bioreactor metagenome]|uniref:Uncharacterized protein n=1 Tax=bioreactor metagenome TaxID=1076179 RepID=A0A644ZC12_9ZZZZ